MTLFSIAMLNSNIGDETKFWVGIVALVIMGLILLPFLIKFTINVVRLIIDNLGLALFTLMWFAIVLLIVVGMLFVADWAGMIDIHSWFHSNSNNLSNTLELLKF